MERWMVVGKSNGLPRELVERMGALGLEPKEARLYIYLQLQGPCRAREASTALHLERAETYRALNELMRRGLVTARLERPTLYEAVPAEDLFDDALARHDLRRTEIQQARERVIEELATLRRMPETTPESHGYKLVRGRRAILEMSESMLRRATTSHELATTFLVPAHATAADRAFQAAARRAQEGDLRMRLLLRDHPQLPGPLRPLLGADGVEWRVFDPPGPVRIVIIDQREVLQWIANDPSPSLRARHDVAIWTDASDFVKAQCMFFDLLWAEARRAGRPVRARL